MASDVTIRIRDNGPYLVEGPVRRARRRRPRVSARPGQAGHRDLSVCPVQEPCLSATAAIRRAASSPPCVPAAEVGTAWHSADRPRAARAQHARAVARRLASSTSFPHRRRCVKVFKCFVRRAFPLVIA